MLMIDPPLPLAIRVPINDVRRNGPFMFTPSTLS
jgi:hypothetical protein